MDENDVIEMIKPFFEAAVVWGSGYANACGRDTTTSKDIEYGMKFAARKIVGKQTESLFPEIYDTDSDEEDEDYDTDEEEDEDIESVMFTRYQGNDEKFTMMNHCYDTWDEWIPETPLESAAQRAVENGNQKNNTYE